MRTHCLGGSFFPGWLEYEIQQGAEIILGMDVNELQIKRRILSSEVPIRYSHKTEP